MKKHLLFVFFAAFSALANAQQDPQLTNWMFDRLSFNPAAAGIDRSHCLTLFHRQQWTGLAGNPATSLFNYNGYANVGYNKTQLIGIGLSAYNEGLGQETNTVMRLAGAYHHNLGASTLSVGVHLGFLNKQIGNNWNPIDLGDASIPVQAQSQTALDVNIGAMLYQTGKYYVGLSATHLPAATLHDVNVQLARHYYLMGGYELPIGDTDFRLRANGLVKTSLKSKTAIDVNANVLWNDMVWAGLSFRPGDAIAPMLGFQKCSSRMLNKTKQLTTCFRIGYSYDVTTSEIREYSSGSHELFGTFCFNFTKVPLKAKHGNPRFL